MVGTIGTEIQKDRTPPVFVPPRKRQTNKKLNGTQNYVDHIVSIQGRNKLASPTSPIIENKLIKTAALLACKTNEVIVDVNNTESKCSVTKIINDNNIIAASSATKELRLDNLPTSSYDNRCNSVDEHLNNLENVSPLQSVCTPTTTTTKDSQNVTPTTANCFYATEQNNLMDENLNNKSIININNSMSSLKLSGPSKKRVNICTDNKLVVVRNENNKQSSSSSSLSLSSAAIINYDEDLEAGDAETNMILNKTVITNDLIVHTNNDNNQNTINNNRIETYLTMTGTIKRGRKKGQSVDLQLNISREELEKINAAALTTVVDVGGADGIKRKHLCCYCTPTIGMHIFLLSILCLPFVTIITSIYSFYIGTITWYNVFNYFNDEKTYLHKLLMSPLLILTYPIVIVLCTIGLGIYAGCIQISVQLNCWLNEIADIEKGFYGWLCSLLHLSDCSPYEVVILTDLNSTPNGGIGTHAHSSTEELSL